MPDRLVAELEALVTCESPSTDVTATATCARLAGELGAGWLGQPPDEVSVDGRIHLRWRFGQPRVLLVGHVDTVWPGGTTRDWPFSIDGDRATGPGVFDMKAGVVQMFAALSQLSNLDGVSVLLTTDEELGSPTSRALVEDSARGCVAALVLEPSADGALKTARKGVSLYTVRAEGKAAHAGLEPDRGVNASLEIAHQVIALSGLGQPEVGTTVTPTVVNCGTTSNTVPAHGSVAVDVRAGTRDEQERVDVAIHALRPVLPGSRVVVEGGPNRPPMDRSATADLFALAAEVATEVGMSSLGEISVGGGSDGNFTAGVGVPTLDGLGAVGGNAHASGEWVLLSALPQRTALVAGLVRRLLT